jgi:Putative Ig domain
MSCSRSAACGGERRRYLPGLLCLFLISVALDMDLAQANTAPVIGGAPPASVLATRYYWFAPRATDADGDHLTFSIRNRPSWAGFDSRNGRLYGTPEQRDVGSYNNIAIFVSDGHTSVGLRPFNIKVVGLIARGPTVSGAPSGSATVGQRYTFQPAATAASGSRLTFRIQNRPWWLTFDSATGRLQGTPGANSLGTFRNIVLSVSDGRTTAHLPAFSIVVTEPNVSHVASVTLDWTPPTANTDLSPITDLAGYHLYYGTTPSALANKVDISDAGLTRYVVAGLGSGTWYFALTAYNREGRESGLSAALRATIH